MIVEVNYYCHFVIIEHYSNIDYLILELFILVKKEKNLDYLKIIYKNYIEQVDKINTVLSQIVSNYFINFHSKMGLAIQGIIAISVKIFSSLVKGNYGNNFLEMVVLGIG